MQREFNRRLKQRFDAESIAFATPTQTVVLKEPGAAPPKKTASAAPPETVTEAPPTA